MKMQRWQQRSSTTIFKNQFFSLQQDEVIMPNGKDSIYTTIHSTASVYIIPLMTDDKMCIVGQYRYPTKQYSWEVPAGSSNGEPVLKAAKRELQEETGFIAKKWEKIGKFQVYNGLSSEYGYIFIARDLIQTNNDKRADEGISKMKFVTWEGVKEMIYKEKLTDAQSVTAIIRAIIHLKK